MAKIQNTGNCDQGFSIHSANERLITPGKHWQDSNIIPLIVCFQIKLWRLRWLISMLGF